MSMYVWKIDKYVYAKWMYMYLYMYKYMFMTNMYVCVCQIYISDYPITLGRI